MAGRTLRKVDRGVLNTIGAWLPDARIAELMSLNLHVSKSDDDTHETLPVPATRVEVVASRGAYVTGSG